MNERLMAETNSMEFSSVECRTHIKHTIIDVIIRIQTHINLFFKNFKSMIFISKSD